ncbi:MAG: glycerol-3-phosphate 1-O-acyltransferase PlsY [Chloroflexota bacterium]
MTLELVLAICLAYLVGAIPLGYVAGKVCRGIDIRDYGSGATGATNTLRTVGVWPAVMVLVGDVGKGMAAVLLARLLVESRWAEAGAAVAAIVGHNWPVYVGFKGGRGVNTSLGAFVAIVPGVALVSAGVALATIAISRYVSLGSMLGVVSGFLIMLPLYILGRQPAEYLAYSLVMATFVLFQHRGNISRLLSGTERRLGEKAEGVP